MLRVVMKGLLAHRFRLVLTTLAIVLGVSFVAGSFILTDSIDDAFTSLFETTGEGTDLYVSRAAELDNDPTQSFVNQLEPLPASVEGEIAAVDGVAQVTGWVESVAQVVGPDGEVVGGNGPPQLGFSWTPEGGPLVVKEGSPPDEAGEVAIDAVTAGTTGYGIGDSVPIVTEAGRDEFTVTAIVGFGESDNLLGATLTAFELEQARDLFGKEGSYDQLAVVAEDGVDVVALRERVGAALGGSVEVETVEQAIEDAMSDIRGFLSVINGVLLGFAFVSMFVGAFIIANTFSIIVAQRMREFALLRAVGASARQVKRAVRGEALIVGLIASALGLLAGIGFAEGLRAVMGAFGIGLPTGGLVLAPRTVVAAFAVGTGVTIVATVLPARRAARVAPVEALRGAATSADAPLGRRTATGAVILALGAVSFGLGAAGIGPQEAILVGVGAVSILLGVATASPALAGPIAAVLGAVPARIGTAGRIARGNAARDRRRTAVTASALMIGLALVTFATILAASLTGSIDETLDEQFAADLMISTTQPRATPLPPVLADELSQLEELGTVGRIRFGNIEADGRASAVAGSDPATLPDLVGLGEVEGDLAALGDDEVFVQSWLVDEGHVAIGETVALTFGRTGTQAYEVVGTYEQGDLVGAPYLVTLEEIDENVVGRFDAVVFANAAEGVDVDAARAAAEGVVAAYPAAELRDQTDLREEAEDSVAQVLGLMMVMLALAIVVALLGITNTLALAVLERTREIGLLRAVGMTRRQVRSMIRWEATIVAVFGAVMGVAVGTVFGWALVRSLEDEGFRRLVLPGGQLAVYVAAAAVAGVVAAALPARRAARLDVLEAVTVE